MVKICCEKNFLGKKKSFVGDLGIRIILRLYNFIGCGEERGF